MLSTYRNILMNGIKPIRYLVRDLFAVDISSGSVNNTNATPGPGTRTVVDTNSTGLLSISNGKLKFDGGKLTPSNGDPGLWYGSMNRLCGRMMLGTVKTSVTTGIGWPVCFSSSVGSGTPGPHAFRLGATGIFAPVQSGVTGPQIGSYEINTEYQLALVLRNNGAFYFIRGGVYQNWTLLWIDSNNTSATCVPSSTSYNMVSEVDNIRVVDLPYPWNTDYGIATHRLSGIIPTGENFSHESNCIIEYTTAKPASSSASVRFRRQDVNNLWYVETLNSGTLTLYERIAGTSVSRGSWTGILGGERIIVVIDGDLINVFVNNTLRISYASATSLKSITTGQIDSGVSNNIISDLTAWPRYISGVALYNLNRL